MKYRIIEEVNGSDDRHFEVEFWSRLCGLFRYRWTPVNTYVDAGCDVASVTKHFATREAALEHVMHLKKTRTVIVEGDTDVN